ncbi:MAG: DUF1045 domain-containing protein [Pseudomonadota bacterium]
MTFKRYAIYYTPAPGPLAAFGAAWLGWDIATAQDVPQPEIAGLPQPVQALTETPRKYGFHATLKPPFRLAKGTDATALTEAVAAFAATHAAAEAPGLVLARLGAFLALVPHGDATAVNGLAGEIVTAFDQFRAPAGAAELARRRAAGLTAAQEANLVRWGYPYVLEEFRFHMTLTGKLSPEAVTATEAALAPAVAPVLPAPFRLDALTLAGEDAAGRFCEITRFPLIG